MFQLNFSKSVILYHCFQQIAFLAVQTQTNLQLFLKQNVVNNISSNHSFWASKSGRVVRCKNSKSYMIKNQMCQFGCTPWTTWFSMA